MCGIFSIIGHSSSVDEKRIREYFNRGKKRGPEYSSFTNVTKDIKFGFHRLCINGLDEISNQPIISDKSLLICNGEIYNYQEISKNANIIMNTNSDCEIIPKLYEICGTNLVHLLDGVFAFLLYDKISKEIVVGRDPYGVRPLYVCQYKNGLIGFSSDVAPLMYDARISSLKQFQPGHIAKYKLKQDNSGCYEEIFKERYFYNVSYSVKTEKPIEYYMYELVNKLLSAVNKRVANCERTVACLLSGGLDSSIISALVSREYKRITNKTVQTFSIGLSEGVDLDYARCVSQHIRSDHSEVIFSNEEFFDSIPHVIKDIESYDTTTVRASVGNWNIAKYIKTTCDAKVIFNGDGADELMGGYLYFHCCPDDESFHKETLRLLDNISKFDVLRSDKSISSHRLEPRTPFLDKEFTKFYLSIPIKYRNHCNEKRIEKYLMRKAIELYLPDLLPENVLWRVKEAFSDGVSSENNAWYKIIQNNISNNPSKTNTVLKIKELTNEQKYYRETFEELYPNCDDLIPYYWMPKFVDNPSDASARTLDVYQQRCK